VTEEKELVERLSAGDPAAFRELVEAYKKKMYFFALDMVGDPADAEDISQEVFLKAFRGIRTFKRDARLGSWLYRIAYNTSVDHLRRRPLLPEAAEDAVLDTGTDGFSGLPPSPDPVRTAESRLLAVRIEKALQNVSDRERTVFVLRHYNDLRLDEIAETMQISIGSVKSYLFRCLRKLRKEFSQSGTPRPLEVSDERL
jgi:RNA polymerase sigma-70 factor (ECF subfamily)